MEIINEIFKVGITIIGVLIMFIVKGLFARVSAVEKENKDIVENYKTRLDSIKDSIAELRELTVTGLTRIDGKLAVDDEKHAAIGARLDAIQERIPKRRKAG